MRRTSFARVVAGLMLAALTFSSCARPKQAGSPASSAAQDSTGGAGEPAASSPPPPPPPPPPPATPPPSGNGGEQQPSNTLPDLAWGKAALPAFPCRPPRPSARYEMPDRLVRAAEGRRTLGEVSRRLGQALDRVGYSERSYFSTCGGYAMVTRLERTRPDGTPWSPERWAEPSLQGRTVERFSLSAILRALFTAPSGYYRVLVFMVTDQPITPAAEGMTAAQAEDLLDRGATALSADLAAKPYGPNHRTLAFIYEFVKPPARDAATQSRPSDKDGRTHLERARILAALGGA